MRRTRGGHDRARLRRSEWEAMLERQLRVLGAPEPVLEHAFAAPARRWRFDFAWPGPRLAAEIEGGIWAGGRHTRGSGFTRDAEKYNAAALAGWRVLRYTDREVRDWSAAREISAALGATMPVAKNPGPAKKPGAAKKPGENPLETE